MREVATIAQAFFNAAETVSSIAKVEFITAFTLEDLQQVRRTPLLLVSPHALFLAYGRHRQRGTQLLLNTYLVSRQQRLERNSAAALELTMVLDALDTAMVHNNLNLAIQPLDIHQRKAVTVEKGLSVVRTIYSTVIYDDLVASKFTYVNGKNVSQEFEFRLLPTSLQKEEIKDNNDYDRVLDGTLKSFSRTAKKKYELRFTLVPMALKDQFWSMKQEGGEITFYRDRDAEATMTCFWTNDFNFYEERAGFWTGSMTLQES
jgi:hypothetical protein